MLTVRLWRLARELVPTHFTSFTGTKVQILTDEGTEVSGGAGEGRLLAYISAPGYL